MKEGFRQSMAWLHTWLGLVVGWILFLVYLTGTLGYLDKEIDYWMTPDRPYFREPGTQQHQLALAQDRLQLIAPDATRWNIQLIGGREAPALGISWVEAGSGSGAGRPTQREILDPTTGKPIDYSARATGGGQVLYKMHYYLAYIPQDAAILFIMACTLIMFTAMVSGVIVHKAFFRDFFTFRPRKGQRSWLDGHTLLSVTALPFHLVVTYSGFLFFVAQTMPAAPTLLYGENPRDAAIPKMYEGVYPYPLPELPGASGNAATLAPLSGMVEKVDALWGEGMATSVEVHNPADANARAMFKPKETQSIAFPETAIVFDAVSGELIENYLGPDVHSAGKADQVLKGLHKGLFADWFQRVLYVFMGVGGTAMVGTGLLLWANKRRNRLLAKKEPLHFGIRLVDRLNLGTVIGMPVAIAAYFWSNRLLPATLSTRAEWEVHIMYLTMAAMFVYPVVRSVDKARREMLVLCAAAYLLLPVVNALTTTRHLGVSLPEGDWIMAGFDLTSLACGLVAAALVSKVRNLRAPDMAARRRKSSEVTSPLAAAPKLPSQ